MRAWRASTSAWYFIKSQNHRFCGFAFTNSFHLKHLRSRVSRSEAMESLVSGSYSVCLRPPKRRDLSIHGMLLISGPVIFIESLLWQSVKRDTGNSRDWLILLKWSDEVWNMFPLPGEWWPLPPWHGLVTVYSLHQDVQSQLVLPQPNPPHPSAWQTELLWAKWRAGNLACIW